jgi:hypothetical protein
MAEAIADLHGFKDGVMVHDDIQLPQFLFSNNNRIKLNDFNRGEVMLYDEIHEKYCRYTNGEGGGDWRAPEGCIIFSNGSFDYRMVPNLYLFPFYFPQ